MGDDACLRPFLELEGDLDTGAAPRRLKTGSLSDASQPASDSSQILFGQHTDSQKNQWMPSVWIARERREKYRESA